VSAVETLQTAIDTLKRLRAESVPGRWEATEEGGDYGVTVRAWFDNEFNGNTAVAHMRHGMNEAELIVTLHRTLDVQLAFLRAARSDLTTERIRETDATHAIALATAINGGAK